jgi:uncharacterized protein DUF3800
MMTLYCDESDDGETYALAGWLGTPTCWKHFELAWRAMLLTLTMPDRSPCPGFHASEIENRDAITRSRFKGWTRAEAVEAFTKATDVIIDPQVCGILWPFVVAAEIPAEFSWVPRDMVWLFLFMKFFEIIIRKYQAQQSIRFVCDSKPEIHDLAEEAYSRMRHKLDPILPTKFEGPLTFADDESEPGIQAADFFAYEWRKRATDARVKPDKAVRTAYRRMREARSQGELWRYDRRTFENAPLTRDPATWAWSVVEKPPSHWD